MEPRGSVGDYNANDGRYTVYTTLQRAHPFRAELAFVLKVPEAKIRVVAGDIGGSFGMKSAVYNEVALVLLASKRIGRPVKWVSTRSEAFLSDAQGRDNVTDAELALDADGTFLALRVKTIANVGAYLQTAASAFIGNLGSLAGVYRTPAIHADVTAVFTNTNPVRPYRGNGRPEAAYVIERLIDLAAGAIGIDPVELRQRNAIPPEALPFRTGLTFTYDSGDFAKNLEMALRLADIDGFAARRKEARRRGKLRGLGVSNTIERAGAPSYEGAEIRFDRSGTVTLFCGAINQGQGHETVFKQILIDRLGLDPADIQYLQGDTDQVFFGEGTGGSRTATLGGAAVDAACRKVIDKARAIAAFALKAEAPQVSFADGVFSAPATNETLTLKEVARLAANPAKLPPGMEPGLVVTAVYRAEVENFPNGAHVCELEIDRETGAVEIVRYSVVDDVGTVLNPLLLHGQITGGIAQGVGQILRENIRFDPSTGELLTGSFMDYAMPRASDFPAIAIKSNPVPTKTNPLGVKGAGEAGTVGAMPAVANALVDALSEFGVRHIGMPATAEVIWRAMRDGKGGVSRRVE
jgi:aerobic carbon-monoxide dehydrogenase large subunit